MTKITRTVVVPSITLTRRKYETLRELEEKYKQLAVELVEYGLANNIKSFTGLKRDKYRELRTKYPQLPSHYVHTACQDASTRIKSFLKLKKKGLAKSDKPEVKGVSIWLDDHLWKAVGLTAIKVATHKGWVVI